MSRAVDSEYKLKLDLEEVLEMVVSPEDSPEGRVDPHEDLEELWSDETNRSDQSTNGKAGTAPSAGTAADVFETSQLDWNAHKKERTRLDEVREYAILVGGVAGVVIIVAMLARYSAHAEETSRIVTGEDRQHELEIGLGSYKYMLDGAVGDPATDGPPVVRIIEFDAAAIVGLNEAGGNEIAERFDQTFQKRNARIRQAIDRVTRTLAPEDLDDPELVSLRQRVREQVNLLFPDRPIKNIIFGEFRSLKSP